MSATHELEHLKSICRSAGRMMVEEALDIAQEMGHAELDPAHFIVAALRSPKDYSVALLFTNQYGLDFASGYELVAATLSKVKSPVTTPPVPNEAMVRMIRMVPSNAAERGALNHETPYPTAYDLGVASLDAGSEIVGLLTATAVAEAIDTELIAEADTSIHPD